MATIPLSGGMEVVTGFPGIYGATISFGGSNGTDSIGGVCYGNVGWNCGLSVMRLEGPNFVNGGFRSYNFRFGLREIQVFDSPAHTLLTVPVSGTLTLLSSFCEGATLPTCFSKYSITSAPVTQPDVVPVTANPEPGTAACVLLGLVVGWRMRRR